MEITKKQNWVFLSWGGKRLMSIGLSVTEAAFSQAQGRLTIHYYEVMLLLTNGFNRMVELLFYVGYCGEFPVYLASRIAGHWDWNRHVVYRALEKGYVTMYRGKYRQRILRSLRLTDAGLEYLGTRDELSGRRVLSKMDENALSHAGLEKMSRAHSLAAGFVMSVNAGAVVFPEQKPSLMLKTYNPHPAIDPDTSYFFSPQEIRSAIRELNWKTNPKTTRLIGIIVHGERLFCLYNTGYSRMYWMNNEEHNTVASINSLLSARGFHTEITSQVIIGNNMRVAKRIARMGVDGQSRYFVITNEVNNCYFLTNDFNGDALLRIIIDPEASLAEDRRFLTGYRLPAYENARYDAITPDGLRPVTLGYQCDLKDLINMDEAPPGFQKGQTPIVLCYDYQADVLQTIVKPSIEVLPITGGTP